MSNIVSTPPLRERMKTLLFWRNRLVELLVSGLAVFAFTTYLETREDRQKENIPASDFFVVEEVFVPDHEVGDNPLIVYDRIIKQDFTGFWVAEIQRRDVVGGVDRFFAACTGSGTSRYERTDYLPDSRVTWEWFMGRPCTVPPGTYRIVVNYDIRFEDYPTKHVRARSNIFNVYPEGGFISPRELQVEVPSQRLRIQVTPEPQP